MGRPSLLLATAILVACTGAASVAPTTEPPPVATAPDLTAGTTLPSAPPPSTVAAPPVTTSTTSTTTTLPPARFGDARGVGGPFSAIDGITQFRGNASRTWYGTGPVPSDPAVAWRYPATAMCGNSSVGGVTSVWCGTGWTGQPVLWERPDGVTELIFGAYDRSVHFVDADTGLATRPSFLTGDIIKGSVTLDPDGFPLLYFGSRDNRLRVLALDRDVPTELWAIDSADYPGIWNSDWDGNPLVIDDILFEGAENGILYVIRLNRSYLDGQVQVDPEVLTWVPGWTDELLADVGDKNASIESSVAIVDDRLYFANSAGRVAGVDLSSVDDGELPFVFDFWVGDDVDATLVADSDGSIYVAAELERYLPRSAEVGQLLKLDPSRADPLVWSVPVPAGPGQQDGGMWATPALGDGFLYAATHSGQLLVVDTETGEVVWSDPIGSHAWSSPVIVDNTLVVAVNCESGGGLRAYDLAEPAMPVELWTLPTETGCIESTPVVWDGRIYVGSRDGYFYAFEQS